MKKQQPILFISIIIIIIFLGYYLLKQRGPITIANSIDEASDSLIREVDSLEEELKTADQDAQLLLEDNNQISDFEKTYDEKTY